jgi:release factor glutamine methyltransferase
MTVIEVIQRSTDFLAKKGVDSPRLQVELLLAHRLAIPRLNLYLQFDRVLTEPELTDLREAVRRRGQREPLQHIVGSTGFFGLELKTDAARAHPPAGDGATGGMRPGLPCGTGRILRLALDFGTGGGCIAIALATQRPGLIVHALDCSAAALELARENALRHGVLDRIACCWATNSGRCPEDRRFHLIVSNPPYIPTAEIAQFRRKSKTMTRAWRWTAAGRLDGLSSNRAAMRPAYLADSGRLFLELGDDQGRAVTDCSARTTGLSNPSRTITVADHES